MFSGFARAAAEKQAALHPGDGEDSCTYLHVHLLLSTRHAIVIYRVILETVARPGRRRVDSHISPLSAIRTLSPHLSFLLLLLFRGTTTDLRIQRPQGQLSTFK